MWPKIPAIPYVFMLFLNQSSHDDDENHDNSNNNDCNKLNSWDQKTSIKPHFEGRDVMTRCLVKAIGGTWIHNNGGMIIGRGKLNKFGENPAPVPNITFYIKLAGRFSGKVSNCMTIVTTRTTKHKSCSQIELLYLPANNSNTNDTVHQGSTVTTIMLMVIVMISHM
jgi:hypothetical protein